MCSGSWLILIVAIKWLLKKTKLVKTEDRQVVRSIDGVNGNDMQKEEDLQNENVDCNTCQNRNKMI